MPSVPRHTPISESSRTPNMSTGDVNLFLEVASGEEPGGLFVTA